MITDKAYNAITEHVLAAIKLVVDESKKTRITGEDWDILDAILGNLRSALENVDRL